MSEIKSQDGTSIAYERSGRGAPLIVVDGALCSRAFGPSSKLAAHLARFGTIRQPTLVMNGSKTDGRLQTAARRVAEVIPGARYRELQGQTHNVKRQVLVPAIVEFLSASELR